MVADSTFRRPTAGTGGPFGDRRGRRWGPTYPRQYPSSENCHQPRQTPRGYRPNPNFRGGQQIMAAPPMRHPQQDAHRQRHEVARTHQERIGMNNLGGQASPKRPQFQAIYQEFENMKKLGLVLNADPKAEAVASPNRVDPSVTNDQGETRRTSSEDFAEAMRIFMRSYLPTSSFPTAKPVDDWSKEAGNLLSELTDQESQSDLDTSVWKIPNGNRRVGSEQAPAIRWSANPWSTTPPKSQQRGTSGAGFDIHRHIMEINPSPYPSGSPLSSGQLSSNHSSDNDADDESTQSSSESTISKAIGAKKSLKRRFHSSFTCSTMDSGYLSSATESDGARACGVNTRMPGSSVDSDDLSSECGFGSSNSHSWPTSPSEIVPANHNGPARCWTEGQFVKAPTAATQISTLQNAFSHAPAALMTRPPVPPPIPPFLTSMAGIPIPPPPHFLPGQIPPVVSVAQPQLASIPRLHPGMPPSSGLALMGAAPPISYAQQFQAHPVQNTISESAAQDSMIASGAYHKHKAWITDEILEMIAVRDRLYKRMKKHPAPDIVEMYKKVRNMVVGMTRNAKRSYEKQFEEQQIEQRLRDSRREDHFGRSNPVPIQRFPRTW